jgi:predicted glutamine amidotransferase
VVAENTHPFTDGSIAFAHNGSIKPPESLDALIPDDLKALRKGTTDSERYFLMLLDRARHTAPAMALAETVNLIASSLKFSSLNAMVATSTQLVAVSRFDAIAEAKEAEPLYYQLRYRVTPNAVVVASSGWGDGWTILQNGEMLVVDRGTLDVSVSQLSEVNVVR